MSLSRDQILQFQDIKTTEVDCPEWGGSVRIRALTLAQAQDWRRSSLTKTIVRDKEGKPSTEYNVDPDKLAKSDVRLIVAAAVDDDGKALFSAGDVELLMQKSPAPVTRLAKAIVELSGMRNEAAEEAEGFSEPNPSDSSSSD